MILRIIHIITTHVQVLKKASRRNDSHRIATAISAIAAITTTITNLALANQDRSLQSTYTKY